MIGSGDYISRKAICLTDFEIIMCKGDYKELCKMILDKIANAPAADVRPVRRGKWIESKSMMEVVYCSECGFRTVYGVMPDGFGRNFSYCPNCGADMREEN